MRILWLLLWASIAWAKPARPPPSPSAPSGPPPPAVSVLFGINPYVAQLPQPPFEGATETLDITSMRRTVVRYEVGLVDPSALPADEAEERALRTLLAADPRWRLTGRPGDLYAARRVQAAAGWTATATGFHEQEGAVWTALLRVGAPHRTGEWADSPLVMRPRSGAVEVELIPAVLQSAPWAGRQVTALSVDGARAGYDVYEATTSTGRAATGEAIGLISEVLEDSATTADLLLKDGGGGAMLPRGEPTGLSPLTLRAAGAGQVELRARVNPGAEGWTWLRLMAGGQAWEDVVVAAGSREVVGWSASPDQGFLMQGVMALPSGVGFHATAELWFAALDGQGPATKVGSWEVEVPAR